MVRFAGELAAKRLELRREIAPNAKRLLVLADPFSDDQLEAVRKAAEQLRVEIIVEYFKAPPYELKAAFPGAGAVAHPGEIILECNNGTMRPDRGVGSVHARASHSSVGVGFKRCPLR